MSVPAPLKQQFRAEARERLAALTPAERRDGSLRIARRIESAPGFARAAGVLGFVPLPSEPDLGPLLLAAAARRLVAVPRWDAATGEYAPAQVLPGDAWVKGPDGVPEPSPSAPRIGWERLDLILVPGLAFDRRGWRLGRGGGYYDRLLAHAPLARRWGVAFDPQLVAEVPLEPHDVKLDTLVTPDHWLTFEERASFS